MSYPAGFDSWPLDERNAYFKREADKYNGNGGKPSIGSSADLAATCAPDNEIARLAALSQLAYEKERKDAAAKIDVRTSILDKLVAAARPSSEKPGQGRSVKLADPEPWESPVDGVELVSEMSAAIRKYVVLSKNDALAASLWVLHCSCFEIFSCPRGWQSRRRKNAAGRPRSSM